VDVEAHRDLRLLEAVHQDSRVTQRGLASKLGIALGLANIYLKRMIRKGYIKCVNVQPNRISYLVTPRGIAEKARLTYEFMDCKTVRRLANAWRSMGVAKRQSWRICR
jgi:predicted transcriptional regulator